MRIIGIIPSRVYVHTSGATASIYGACPWTSEAGKAEWRIVERGFTYEMSNGTVGCGRVPEATREEAEAFMARYNARFSGGAS